MSFSDPVHIIDHIPRDFDMKRITRKRPLEQRRAAKQARQNVEPFSCERPGPDRLDAHHFHRSAGHHRRRAHYWTLGEINERLQRLRA